MSRLKRKIKTCGMTQMEIAKQIGVPPYVVTKKYKPALRSYTAGELMEALDECAAADHESKSGRIDAAIAVEMIIARHSARE